MKLWPETTIAVVLFLSFSMPTYAKICDYRPSKMMGGVGSAALGMGGAMVASMGGAAKAAGIYTLTNATTGLTMLGSTLPGLSGAGTLGILAGTSGAIGTAGAIVTAPATIAAGVVVAVVTGGFEGVCFFKDERITEYDDVLAIMLDLEKSADPKFFSISLQVDGRRSIFIRNESGGYDSYAIEDLYIVEGTLKARDWGMNTTIGNVGVIDSKK